MKLVFFLLKIVSLLPLRVLYFVADVFSPAVRLLYRKKTVEKNLKKAFPEKSLPEIQRISKQFYRNFTDMFFETIKAITISQSALAKRVRFINFDILDPYLEKNQPVIIYTSHQFNWEWASLGSPYPFTPLYQPLQNKASDDFFLKFRSRFGGTLISRNEGVRDLLDKKNQFHIITIIADQAPPIREVFWTHFFGVASDFYKGIVRLPYLFQAPTFFGHSKRESRGEYQIELVKMTEPPYDRQDDGVLKKYVGAMERVITENPENYLWTHNRWKHKKPQGEKII